MANTYITISFEGAQGSGKSHLMRALGELLTSSGIIHSRDDEKHTMKVANLTMRDNTQLEFRERKLHKL